MLSRGVLWVRSRLAREAAGARVATAGAQPADSLALGAHAVELALAAGTPPDWIHLLPAGAFAFRDGRGPYQLADPAEVLIASRTGSLGGRLPIDYDHAIDYAASHGFPAPAAGWIEELEARADGIWGRVAWTERAAAAIKGLEYRHLSPVFQHRSDGSIVRILRAALTNNPAIAPLTALASATETGMDLATLLAELRTALGTAKDADAKAVLAAAQTLAAAAKTVAGLLVKVATAAGLPATAKAEEIVTAVAAAAAAAAPDPAQFAPMTVVSALQAEVAALRAGRQVEAATAAVEAAVAAGKVTPAQRDWALGYAKADLKGFEGYVALAPVLASSRATVPGTPPALPGGGDPLAIGALARDHIAAQAAKGVTINAADAVRHVMAQRV